MSVITPSQRVAKARQKLKEAGGRRLQLWLQPDAADALQRLLDSRYADSAAAVVSAALLAEARKVGRR